MVQGTVQGGIRRYVLVCTGTYWYVPISAVQPGYAALRLDSLLQFCPADSAVLETSASNDSNASSSIFQSTLGPADPSAAPVFGGTRLRLPQRLSQQEPAALQGRRKGLDGGARGLDVVGIGIGVAGAGGAASGMVVVLVFLRMFS